MCAGKEGGLGHGDTENKMTVAGSFIFALVILRISALSFDVYSGRVECLYEEIRRGKESFNFFFFSLEKSWKKYKAAFIASVMIP